MTYLFNTIGFVILALFIFGSLYVSHSVEHFLKLQDGEKPSLWSIPGIMLFGIIIGFATSNVILRVILALVM